MLGDGKALEPKLRDWSLSAELDCGRNLIRPDSITTGSECARLPGEGDLPQRFPCHRIKTADRGHLSRLRLAELCLGPDLSVVERGLVDRRVFEIADDFHVVGID